jgi:hypothetical protein
MNSHGAHKLDGDHRESVVGHLFQMGPYSTFIDVQVVEFPYETKWKEIDI